MLDAYDFGEFRTVADIGGGNGSALAAILERPPAECRVFCSIFLQLRSGTPFHNGCRTVRRCLIEGGDFFLQSLPSADAYVMRHIIMTGGQRRYHYPS